MPQILPCPSCGAKLQALEATAGAVVKCARCGYTFQADPEPAQSPPAPPWQPSPLGDFGIMPREEHGPPRRAASEDAVRHRRGHDDVDDDYEDSDDRPLFRRHRALRGMGVATAAIIAIAALMVA